jgi:uncharacterized integral membrane protein (TIGR00698 family)
VKGPSKWLAAWRGLALSVLLGVASVWLAGWPALQLHGISPLTVAIVLGMLVGNTLYPSFAPWAGPGVALSRTTVLRLGVVLYGFRLTLQDVVHVGWVGVLIDAIMLASTFVVALQVGTRLLGLDRESSMLVGAGSAICGAAAVLAAEPVVRGKAEQVSVAVAGVVIFGTISMFLYPLLAGLNDLWNVIPGGPANFGIYIGSTVHEVAQVVAAARQVGPEAAGTAVIAKMVRVLMLAPFLVVLSTWLRTRERGVLALAADGTAARPPAVPAFAFIFVGTVLFNSLDLLPKAVVEGITRADTFLLAMAMGALGLSTHFGTLRRAGGKPMLLAFLLFLWLVIGGAGINRVVTLLGH